MKSIAILALSVVSLSAPAAFAKGDHAHNRKDIQRLDQHPDLSQRRPATSNT